MANYTLTAKSALGGYPLDQKGLKIREISHFKIFSLGVFKGCDQEFAKVLDEKFDVAAPKPGRANVKGDLSILSIARDQWFLRLPDQDGYGAKDAARDFAKTAAVTDQSDSWVSLELSGRNIVDKLERLCPIDIDKSLFPVNAVARTSMAHLGVIITRMCDTPEGHSCFLLLSPSSSAKSFLHALN